MTVRQVSPPRSAHFCTCAQRTSATLLSLPGTSPLAMAPQSACADRVAQQMLHMRTEDLWHTQPPWAKTCSHLLLPSPAQVFRAPHLNPISTKPTHLSSQFRQAGTRVYVQPSPPSDQHCYCTQSLPAVSRFRLSYCQNFTHVHTENRGEPLKVLSMSSATVQRIPEQTEIRDWTSMITLCNMNAYGAGQSLLQWTHWSPRIPVSYSGPSIVCTELRCPEITSGIVPLPKWGLRRLTGNCPFRFCGK